MMQTVIIKHPIVQHKLTQLRKQQHKAVNFRNLVAEISMLLLYEALQDLELTAAEIKTLAGFSQNYSVLDQQKIILLPILRSGLAMLDAGLQLLPNARIGHLGLERDPKAVGVSVNEYYCKLPSISEQDQIIILDPMIATGRTAWSAIKRAQACKPREIIFVGILGSRQGIDFLEQHAPNIKLYIAAIDPSLDLNNYIVPGIGDMGDRLYTATYG